MNRELRTVNAYDILKTSSLSSAVVGVAAAARLAALLMRRRGGTVLTLLLMAASPSGCRPAPSPPPEPAPAPLVQPAVPKGIFNGGWRRGGRQFYAIDHEIGRPPSVTIFTNAMARAEAVNITYHGRKLEFDQIEYAVEHSLSPDNPADHPVYTATGSVWHVTMRVAINDPHTLLLEKRNASVIHKNMLYRMPRQKEARANTLPP